jgi:hypothetical protein
VGARHVPSLEVEKGKQKINEGQRYIVLMRREVHKKSKAVLLRLCVYTGGESPGFAPKDMDAPEGQVSYQRVHDTAGRSLEPSMEFSVLLFGQVVLIQNRAGARAADSIHKVIHFFGQKLFGKQFVCPRFVSVLPTHLMDQIKDAGGITSVSFGVAETIEEDGAVQPLHKIMDEYRDRLGGSRSKVQIGAGGGETLDMEESIRLFEHAEDEGLENVMLRLKNGQAIKERQMSLKKSVQVRLRNGVPDCEAVDRELLNYLHELTQINANGQQYVTGMGAIGEKLRIITIKTDR